MQIKKRTRILLCVLTFCLLVTSVAVGFGSTAKAAFTPYTINLKAVANSGTAYWFTTSGTSSGGVKTISAAGTYYAVVSWSVDSSVSLCAVVVDEDGRVKLQNATASKPWGSTAYTISTPTGTSTYSFYEDGTLTNDGQGVNDWEDGPYTGPDLPEGVKLTFNTPSDKDHMGFYNSKSPNLAYLNTPRPPSGVGSVTLEAGGIYIVYFCSAPPWYNGTYSDACVITASPSGVSIAGASADSNNSPYYKSSATLNYSISLQGSNIVVSYTTGASKTKISAQEILDAVNDASPTYGKGVVESDLADWSTMYVNFPVGQVSGSLQQGLSANKVSTVLEYLTSKGSKGVARSLAPNAQDYLDYYNSVRPANGNDEDYYLHNYYSQGIWDSFPSLYGWKQDASTTPGKWYIGNMSDSNLTLLDEGNVPEVKDYANSVSLGGQNPWFLMNYIQNKVTGEQSDYKGYDAVNIKDSGKATDEWLYGYDENQETPYLWNPETGTFLTYENSRSLNARTSYVNEEDLAGVIIWEMSGDDTLRYPMTTQLKDELGEDKDIIGYYTSWSIYNQKHQRLFPDELPWDLLTVVNYSFWDCTNEFSGGGTNYKLRSLDPYADFETAQTPASLQTGLATVTKINSIDSNNPYDSSKMTVGTPNTTTYPQGIYTGSPQNAFGIALKCASENPDTRLMLSVGGWTRGNGFAEMTSTAAGRKSFIDSCVSFIKAFEPADHKGGIGGIDLDWEYPGEDRTADYDDPTDRGNPGTEEDDENIDKPNYALFIRELRAALDKEFGSDKNSDTYKWITACIPASPTSILQQDMEAVFESCDRINVMTYDYHGAFDAVGTVYETEDNEEGRVDEDGNVIQVATNETVKNSDGTTQYYPLGYNSPLYSSSYLSDGMYDENNVKDRTLEELINVPANCYSTQTTVEFLKKYLKSLYPEKDESEFTSKLTIGTPYYSRGWAGVETYSAEDIPEGSNLQIGDPVGLMDPTPFERDAEPWVAPETTTKTITTTVSTTTITSTTDTTTSGSDTTTSTTDTTTTDSGASTTTSSSGVSTTTTDSGALTTASSSGGSTTTTDSGGSTTASSSGASTTTSSSGVSTTASSSGGSTTTTDSGGSTTASSSESSTTTEDTTSTSGTPLPDVQSINASPTNQSILIGGSFKIDVEYLPGDADPDQMKVIYTSLNETVVTVDENGIVTGKSTGSTKIRVSLASDPSIFDEIDVTVMPIEVTKITVTPSSYSITVGESYQFKAVITPDNATNQNITWSVSDTSIATIDQNGTVTGLKAGTVTVTATAANGEKGTAQLTVKAKEVADTGVTVSPKANYLKTLDTLNLTATVTPSNATNKNVSWKSSDTSVATVDKKGVVTGVSSGKVTITATTASGKSDTATVYVSFDAVFKLNSTWALVNGDKKVQSKTMLGSSPKVQLYGGKTMVPLRFVTETMGFTVSWDDATNTASVSQRGKTAKVTIGSDVMTIIDANGKTSTQTLTVSARLIGASTYLPLRAISEALDCKVKWEEMTYNGVYTGYVSVSDYKSMPDSRMTDLANNAHSVLKDIKD